MSQKKLLDLPDDVLLKILRNLGFASDLHTSTLREMAHAFILAQTCRRLLKIFCDAITSIDAQLTSDTSPPPFHPTHQAPHLQWLIRHARELKSLKLPLSANHALLALPCDSSLEELELNSEYEGTAPQQLPRTLTKLNVSTPSCDFTSLLRTLTSCALTELHVSSLYLDQIPDFLNFFKHSAKALNLLYVSFFLSSDNDARERDNQDVTTAVRNICESYTSAAPKISSMHFAVTSNSRCDTDWDTFDAYELQPRIEELRKHKPSSLRILGFHTDVDLVSDWVHAISPAVTQITWVSAEAALNCFVFPPPCGLGNAPFVVHVRMTTDITRQHPPIDQLRASPLPIHSIYLTDRAVIDRYFCTPQRHQKATMQYAAALSSCESIFAPVPFGIYATRFAIYELQEVQNVVANLLADPRDAPERLAYSFFCNLFKAACGAKTVKLSFDCVSYVHENESMMETMLSHLPNVEQLKLVMPIEGHGSSREGLVNATPGFLVGLPVFLRLLAGACVNLKYLYLQDIGDMAWSDRDEKELLLGNAEHALREFEKAWPCVQVDSIRAMLQYWRRGVTTLQ